MAKIALKDFGFSFDASGRLRQLSLPGGGLLLHETELIFEVAPGRRYCPSGWDECFPTIEPSAESPVMGALVWTPAEVRRSGKKLEQCWTDKRWIARRVFSAPTRGELCVAFEATNASSQPTRFLWASHLLLAVQELAEIVLPGGRRLDDFTRNDTAEKFFARNTAAVHVRRNDATITLTTDQPWWGIWLNRGNWPAAHPAQLLCVGVEPTNINSDLPNGAVIAAGGIFQGKITLKVS